MKRIVVAYDQNRVIGREGGLPWAGQMRTDMKHFTDSTMDSTVIMGSRTFASIPEKYRPLPGRQNIILSKVLVAGDDFRVAQSLDEAYALAEHETINIIGGGQVYEQALPTVDQVIATEIHASVENGDTYFPRLAADEWSEVARQEFPADARNIHPFAFVTYVRIS